MHRKFITIYIMGISFCKLDQGRPVDVMFLHFQKAFDKVPHKRLLMKLRALGIDGNTYSWIEDWLSERAKGCIDGWVVILEQSFEWHASGLSARPPHVPDLYQ